MLTHAVIPTAFAEFTLSAANGLRVNSARLPLPPVIPTPSAPLRASSATVLTPPCHPDRSELTSLCHPDRSELASGAEGSRWLRRQDTRSLARDDRGLVA